LQKEKDGDYLLTMLKKGTISDKVSALSIIIQKDEQRSITYLRSLLNQAKKPNRKLSEQAMSALRDLFLQNILKDDNKLFTFSKHPHIMNMPAQNISDKSLLQAHYDHSIKELYRDYVTNTLQSMTHDDLEHYRKFSLDILAQLLSDKPELEE
jgi:ribosome biogenesis protein MAK21